MLGRRREQQHRQPLVLGVGGDVIEPFPHRFGTAQIMMLVEQLMAAFHFTGAKQPHL